MDCRQGKRAKFAAILGAPTGGWKRQIAIVGVCVGVTAGMAYAGPKPRMSTDSSEPVTIHARQLDGFVKSDAAVRRFGRLEWRGGLVLSSPSRTFGGWSGLSVSPDGTSLLAVSDAGSWLRGKLLYERGQVKAIKSAEMGPIRALDGSPLRRSRDRDAEALTLISGTLDKGTALIAFEQNNRIGVFPLSKAGPKKPSRYLTLPAAVRSRRGKDGLESVTVLQGGPRNGAIHAVLERGRPGDGGKEGWLIKNGRMHSFTLTDLGGFEVTDAASLTNGDVIFLERRFRWSEGVRMRLRRVEASSIKPKAVLKGEVLLEADMNQQIDNMEGLAIHRNSAGETILTLISDDNFNRLLQRTVLLQFALLPAAKSAKSLKSTKNAAGR